MKRNETPIEKVKELWEEFGEVAINDKDQILTDWHGFKKGTDRFEIWNWFEEEFNVSVAMDLMELPESEV